MGFIIRGGLEFELVFKGEGRIEICGKERDRYF